MVVWRLTSAAHPDPTGEGARLAGGRWNHPGTAVVYTAESESLAVLGYLVHLDTDEIPDDVVLLAATIPDEMAVATIDPATLPNNWRTIDDHEPLQTMGTAWAQQNSTTVLQVPSAVVQTGRNYLLNPNHPDFTKITWSNAVPYGFDSRLFPDKP